MDTTQLTQIRAGLLATVEKNATRHREILAQITTLTTEQTSIEASLRDAAEELRNFDDVFGKRLTSAGVKVEQPGAVKAPVAVKERTAGLKGRANGSKRTATPTETKRAASKKPATTVKRAATAPKAPAKTKNGGAKKAAKTKNGGEAKVKASGKKTTGVSRALLGRRAVASGERPSIKEAIRKVMGNKAMSAQEVYDALKEKGWLPNAKDPRMHVGHILSSLSVSDGDEFQRVPEKGRGFYRLTRTDEGNGSKRNGSKRAAATTNGSKRAAAVTNGSKRAAANGSKHEAKRTAAASNGSKRNGSKKESTDDILEAAGINVRRRSTEATVT